MLNYPLPFPSTLPFSPDVATILTSMIDTSLLFYVVFLSLYVNMHILVWPVFELYINGILLSIPLHFASLLNIMLFTIYPCCCLWLVV